jgi:CzcA family heavy metal efflux pump
VIGSLVRFSIRRPWVVLCLAMVVLVYGGYRLTNASLDVFPEFSPTQVVVQTESPGLSAELVETLVTRPIESGIAGISGVQQMRSQSIPGLSVVTVVFSDGSDIYRNRQLVAERVGTLAGQMPSGIAPNITPLTSSASTLLGIGLTSDRRTLAELRTFTDTVVRPHLLAVTGVADVNVFGGEVEQWQVQLLPERLQAYAIPLDAVLEATRRATGVRGAGFVENRNQRIIVVPEGQATSPEELGRTAVAQRGDKVVQLSEVARVVPTAAPSISAAGIDARPGVFLMVQGQLGANTRAVTIALERSLAELAPLLARERISMNPRMFRPANFIETAVGNVQKDILIGSALVVLVLFLFLFNARTAFVSATAIPLSLVAAMLVLHRYGVALNIMVLGGLAIALGEVVDDAIIDCENIFRRLRENRALERPRASSQVVLDASLEVRSSVVYATFIVALVFVPLLALSGVAGKLFAPLGLAYICAILASLLVALTVTPALSYLLLADARLGIADPPLIAWIKPLYREVLSAIERAPGAVVGGVAVVLTVGMTVLPLFGGGFIPPLKEGHYILHMTAVPGTSQAEMVRVGNRISDAVRKIPGVVSVAQWVGRAPNGADTAGPHYSEFEIELSALSGAEQERVLKSIRRLLSGDDGDRDRGDERVVGAAGIPGVNFAVNTFLTERIEETVAGYASEVVLSLYGPDLDELDRDAQAIAVALARVPGATDVQLQAPPGIPELSVRLRRDKLAAYGIAPASVLDVVQLAYEGVEVGRVFQGSRAVPVSVTLPPEYRGDVGKVAALPLSLLGGRRLALAEVADVQQIGGRYKILHVGGKRVQTVTANVTGRDTEDFVRAARARIAAEVKLAPGDYVVFSGEAEAQARARQDLLVNGLLAAVGIAILLFIAFANTRNLLLTFLNLPFALVGGVIAVLGTGAWMSLGSLVGFVTLFGITLRNSIMLTSHYQHLVEDEGLPWNAETAQRGAAERLPSILMTALVTALGLLPLALGSGEPGREIEGPMATIIVGGLATSTILNLLILPTILLHYGRFGGGVGASAATSREAPEATPRP